MVLVLEIKALTDHRLSELSYLSEEDVIVIVVKTKEFFGQLKAFTNYLSKTEMARAESYKTESLKNKFIIHRALLRVFCSKLLGLNVGEVDFLLGENGKPYLSGSVNKNLGFNLSHCQQYALYAFANNAEVGVDVEEPRPIEFLLETAELFLAETELSWLKQCPAHFQVQQFFRLWTKKEAISKALGSGLSKDFREIYIGKAKSLIYDANGMSFRVFDISAKSYIAAVATSNKLTKPADEKKEKYNA